MSIANPPLSTSQYVSVRHLLHERDAAKVLAVSPAWLQRERWKGTGPDYVRHGRAVRYEYEALARWIDEHRRTTRTSLEREVK